MDIDSEEELHVRMEELSFADQKGTGFLYDERMSRHYCTWNSEYTEIPERLLRCYERCEQLGLVDRCVRVQSRFATQEEMMLLHDEELVNKLKSTSDMSTEEMKQMAQKYDYVYFHPAVYDNSRLALGSSIELVEQVLSNQIQNGMALVRPPGHHAMQSKFCGYCYFNNVATAAQVALDKHGLERVLIVDWDVHHGQGTQFMFYDDPRVLYFSIHRHEHGKEWPNLDEAEYTYIGEGAGKGYNINLPLNVHGCGDSDYMAIILQLLLPVAFEFNPQLILVSAGFDAAIGCPEGEMQVSPAFFPQVVSLLSCLGNGQICLILEGGYCLTSLAEGAALSVRALLGDPCPLLEPLTPPCNSVKESILNCLKVLRYHWKSLCHQGILSTDQKPEFPSLIQWPSTTKQDRISRETFSLEESCYNVNHEDVIAGYLEKLNHWMEGIKYRQTEKRVCLGYSQELLNHRSLTDGNFPECPERLTSIMSTLDKWGLTQRCLSVEDRNATDEELSLVHSSRHINLMVKMSRMDEEASKKYQLTFNSVFLCKETNAVARRAVGTLLSVVDAVMEDKASSGIAVVRPPGHHAEESHPMGFCIFNNVAIAAKYAISRYKMKRVLILDWDVHHGNGIQNMFYEDDRVLYMSLHRFDDGLFFPSGSDGHYYKVGEAAGKGFNVNIPWGRGRMGDVEYIAAFQQIILPVAYEFCPHLVLISAGFDAARGDYLGGYELSPQCFAFMTKLVMGLANARVVLSLEGGYDQEMTSAGVALCASVLLGDPCPPLVDTQTKPCDSAIESIKTVLGVQKEFWSTLCFQVDLPDEEYLKKIRCGTHHDLNSDSEESTIESITQTDEVCSGLSQMSVKEENTAYN